MYLSLVSSKVYEVVKVVFHTNKRDRFTGSFTKDKNPVTELFLIPDDNAIAKIKEVIKPYQYFNDILYEKGVISDLGKMLRKYRL